MINIDEIDDTFIRNLITYALNELDRNHEILFSSQMNEPCINHHFANYIDKYLLDNILDADRNIYVDCEYSKNLNKVDGVKNIFLTNEEASLYIRGYTRIVNEENKLNKQKRNIIPDIIVHKRNGPNYLVFETKRKNNRSKKQKNFDLLKLKKYTTHADDCLNYKYGIYIEFYDGNIDFEQIKRKHIVYIYKNGIRLTTAST